MEVVLQWLDELDDLLFALLLKWEDFSIAVLLVGLLAALLVHASQLGIDTIAGPLRLLQISLSCVAGWGSLSLLAAIAEQRAVRNTESA